MSPTASFDPITKHDYNFIITSSTSVKLATHRSDSDSDVLDDHVLLILKPKHACRKLSINLKLAVLSR